MLCCIQISSPSGERWATNFRARGHRHADNIAGDVANVLTGGVPGTRWAVSYNAEGRGIVRGEDVGILPLSRYNPERFQFDALVLLLPDSYVEVERVEEARHV